ncbi:MAG: putative glycoside hydrolase, partial [Patescibacteria group bacterium]
MRASSSVEYLGGGATAEIPKVVHLSTPEPLKGVYMTACVAGMPSLRDKVVALIEATELNAVVVDIKDYTGTISFDAQNTGMGCKVTDMKDFIKVLHDKQIYVIGRLTVFQDPLYTKLHPELAVKKKSDGAVWQDRKGLSFIDVGAKEYWNYIVEISKKAEKLGFDEINFDYIRYPSDGNMNDITFPHTGLPPARAGGAQAGTTTKKEMLRQFFEYLDSSLKDIPLKTSADLFGMVTTNIDDMGIGQTLENALPYFDYISPMVYPSHYPPAFNGWSDPNKVPYEIVRYAMDGASKRTEELASTTRQNFTTQNL